MRTFLKDWYEYTHYLSAKFRHNEPFLKHLFIKKS